MRIWRCGIQAVVVVLVGLLTVSSGQAVRAQQAAQTRVWVQIEARPDLATALDRVRAYAASFPQVQGYRLKTGWYAIALGPLTSDEAVTQLQNLTTRNAIPADSYIADGTAFGDQFWPAGAQTAAVDPTQSLTPLVAPLVTPTLPSDETIKEARASEAALSDTDRQDLQAALKWFGYYDGKVDGHFGGATRSSMANWQSAEGYDPTGVLTSVQRKKIVEGYKSEDSVFGFQTVSEPESAIEIALPMAMLRFDRYTPPFVRYAPKAGSGLTALLISEPGATASLSGLYDVLQSLEIVPAGGERLLAATSFTIHGRSDKIETIAYAEIDGSNVKGYLLSWDVALADQMQRVLPMVQTSFRSTSGKAMDPGLVPLGDATKKGLLAGLATKKPKLSRSGFFVDAKGSVLTTAEAVAHCGRITLDRTMAAKVTFTDPASGVAVLTPDAPLSPKVVAEFTTSKPEAGAAVAVSGYSYQDRLPAPVLTRGTLEEGQGLNGEAGLSRLALVALPGDAGGPVLNASGSVVGMLLPAMAGAQELPPGVAFAASAAALTELLTNPQGPALTLNAETAGSKTTPDAFNAAARGMTVLVSCWE